MARINIPLDALTSRLNLQGRFDSVRSQSLMNRFANLKPISEFLNIKALSKPRDFGEMQNRVNYNLSHFSSNYAVVFVMLSIYSLLTNLLLLFVIVLVVGGMFGISKLDGRDLDVGFARATSSQLYTGLLVIAVPLGLWASPIATVLWLIGASMRPLSPRRRFRSVGRASLPPYETGRPPGALSSDNGAFRRRRYDDDWELRQSARFSGRFEDLGSEDDGILLDSRGYAPQRGVGARNGAFLSDELYFDGYDLARDRTWDAYDYGEEFEVEDAYDRQTSGRARDGALIQSAMQRIADARSKGRTNVNLSQEEMRALERRSGIQQPESSISHTKASPPRTPGKSSKSKSTGSRSSSSTSLANSKGRKKASYFGEKSSSSPAKSNSKTKVDTKSVPAEPSTIYSPATPPGIMVPGPNGVPIFAPLVNYPSAPDYTRTHGARPRSRSSSKHSRRESTPPERADPYAAHSPRYLASQSTRPASSSSNRSIGDEYDYYAPRSSRKRLLSNAQYYRPAVDDYDVPAGPAAPGRRNVSGPADVRYGNLRRVPPASSPLASRPEAQHAYSDPAVSARRSTMLGPELERTSTESSSSDDQGGIQVNVVPDAQGGFSINRAPTGVTSAAPAVGSSSGNERRRRKGGRR